MSLKYKIDILKELSSRNITLYKIRKYNLLSESTLQHIREGEPISMKSLDTICWLLSCQPGDLLEYIPRTKEDLSEFC